MSSTRTFLIVLAVWALIYLPWLGSSGLRSEEGHRVMPAVEMLESGNFLVPHVAGEPYVRKPPLINWLVAASFKFTGLRNDWTARLPSPLSILLVAIVLVVFARRALGNHGATAAALAWLTSLGMIEKGRMIEIEALYVSLCAVALIAWLLASQDKRSPWLIWILPAIFLGLGLLTKGPTLLLFFYACVTAVLWKEGKLRALLHPAHIASVVAMCGIFAAWAVPYSRAIPPKEISGTWSSEMLSRFTGAEATFHDWLLNFPLGIAYFLPFALLLPFVRFAKMPRDDERIARALLCGAAMPFVTILLLPGAIPRYVLPIMLPACWIFGLAIKADAFEWRLPLGRRVAVSAKIVWRLATVIAVSAAVIFPLRSATVLRTKPGFAAAAAPINAALPAGEQLYAVDPEFQPYLLYIKAPVKYVQTMEQLPPDARYFVVRAKLQRAVESSPRWGRARPRLIARTPSFRGRETLLYEVAPP